jgi:hypothetical protein
LTFPVLDGCIVNLRLDEVVQGAAQHKI